MAFELLLVAHLVTVIVEIFRGSFIECITEERL